MEFTARIHYFKLSLVALISLVIAASWLVFPYLINGKDLLRDAGTQARLTKGGRVSLYLTRYLVEHPELELTATFATEEFFQFVDRTTRIGNLRPDRDFIFYVSENIHTGQLSNDLPEISLHLGDEVFTPQVSSGPRLAEHHRITVYSIPKKRLDGSPIRLDDYAQVRLFVAGKWMGSEKNLTFVGIWNAPYELPEVLSSSAGIAPLAMMALGAGLLSSVLTPCLLQLLVIFGSIIGAFATVPGSEGLSGKQVTPEIRRKVMFIAAAFVTGFTLLYTLAGAVIGSVGHQAQLLFAEYSRTVAIVAGVIVIAMGVWVGLRGLQNSQCKIPDRRTLALHNKRDMAGAILVSMGYALGCTACFGGAIVATLIIYVGAIGSALVGAGVMLTFSIGVAIPFLLSAWYISKTDTIVQFLAQKARLISLASMLLIILFGLILVTDTFHVISDFIYPFLRLR